jgi:predicted nucleic acid-binding protein
MSDTASLRAVIDTNVVFEGLTYQGGAPGLIIDAWLAGVFQPCVSNALAYEYADVLARKLSDTRFYKLMPVLDALLGAAEWVPTYFSWRPSVRDPGDEHVVDCAMNAGAAIVTSNIRDFRLAERWLGARIWTPVEFVHRLSAAADDPSSVL